MRLPAIEPDSRFRLALLAITVGLVASLGAVVFRGMIAVVHNLAFLGELSFLGDADRHTPAGPWGWGIIFVPVIGGLAVVWLVRRFAPEAKGHGVPEVMDAIYFHHGRIRPAVAAIKACASAITIGTGGAVGREGPIIQIGGSFGSTLGQWIRMPEWQRTTLIASGAAGGIAATFNTPLGGLVFAIELILPETSSRTLIPVALATGAATYVGRWFFGTSPAFDIPALTEPVTRMATADMFAVYLVLGVLLGLAGLLYIRAVYDTEQWLERLIPNEYLRAVLAMGAVGTLMYWFLVTHGQYYVQGVGYATVQDILVGALTDPVFLLLLFVAKLAATSLTLGGGGSGGIFSPSLFLGATLGAAYALLLDALPMGVHLNPAHVAVTGMAGLVGGVTGAVVTAIVMIFEMTRDYSVIVPLMVAVPVAYGVRRSLMKDSIYSFKLSRRGHYLPDSLQTNLFMLRSAADIFHTPFVRTPPESTLSSIRLMPQRGRRPMPHVLLVRDGAIHGVLTAELHKAMRRRGELDVPLIDRAETHFIVVSREDMIFDVIAQLRAADANVALLTEDGKMTEPNDVIGVLTLGHVVQKHNLPRQLLNGDTDAADGRRPPSAEQS